MANLLYRSSLTPAVPTATELRVNGLTNAEIDGNFRSLNDDITEKTNKFQYIKIDNTDTEYSWVSTDGTTIQPEGYSDTVTLVSGANSGITISADTTNDAVKISHANTSDVSDVSVNNSGNTFIQDITFTFDGFGHVVSASAVSAAVVETTLKIDGGTAVSGDLTITGSNGISVTQGGTGSKTFTIDGANSFPNLSNDITTNATYYPVFYATDPGATTVRATEVKVSNSKLTFNPSTGQLNAVDYNSTSDARLKDNVVSLSDALSKVNAINGYSYTLKSDLSNTRRLGVLAQEIMNVVPEVVNGSEETTYSVSYGALVPLLIEAIKELTAEVNSLKNQLSNK